MDVMACMTSTAVMDTISLEVLFTALTLMTLMVMLAVMAYGALMAPVD